MGASPGPIGAYEWALRAEAEPGPFVNDPGNQR